MLDCTLGDHGKHILILKMFYGSVHSPKHDTNNRK